MPGPGMRAIRGPAGCLAIAVSLPFMLYGTAHSVSPAQLLANALAASRAQSSVRWTGRTVFGGLTETITTNAGADKGGQSVTVVKGGSHGEITVDLVGDTAYVNGDSFALSNYMGFTTKAASDEANRWVAVPHSNPDFSVAAAGLTVASTTSELELTGPITSLADSVVLGQKVVGLEGKSVPHAGQPESMLVLYVKAQGVPLPVEAKATYQGVTSMIVLGHWNERVVVKAPSGATPFQTSWL